ncbi:MAG: efflux RND transporter permease subunit [Nannocystaceae bacterium]|nr:efflux RND transporter permease subunit [Nannocystaceae bacterium]
MKGAQSHALVSLSLRRPVTMMMMLLSMLVLGGIALARIPLELIPSGFSPPFLRIAAEYPDATAKDVEERITRPLEDAVATTPGIDQISATSTSGSSSITIVFKNDVDMDIAYRQVRDRITRIRSDLPDEVDKVEIRKESAEAIPVAFYSVAWDPDLPDPQGVIEQALIRPLQRIEGVGLVNVWGEEKKEVRIEIDRGLAEAHGLDMVSIAQTLGTSNFTMASGTLEEDEGQYMLRSVASWDAPEDIAELIVGQNGVRLRDIGTVTFDFPVRTRYDRYRGRPSLVLFVVKESTANTVEVSEKIKAVAEQAQKDPLLQGVTVQSIFVQGDTIRYSLQQVVDAGKQGGLLALCVLLFFLRRLRLTVIISLAIPLSLFLALPFMYFSGQSVNLVSLIGLMICIGLVVDNSVVVAENIGRYRKRGLGPYAAALQGASEVGLAITLATMTTIVVFLPAALLSSGPTQFFMVRMVTPVCVSLVASLFVALVLIPLSSATLLADDDDERERAPVTGWRAALRRLDDSWKHGIGWLYDKTMGRLGRSYVLLLRLVLRRRFDVVVVSLLAMASMVVPAMHVQCNSGNEFGTRNITVSYSMPSDTTLEEANVFFSRIEARMNNMPPESKVDGAYVGFDDQSGRVQIFFQPPEPGEPDFETLAKELADSLPTPPGWRKRSQFGDADGGRDDSFPVVIYGSDHERVQDARERLEEQLLDLEGVIGLKQFGGDDRRRNELALSIDRTMSERFGVSGQVVANTVAYAIRGTPLPRFHTQEREVDVRLRYREDDRRNVDQLLGYRVPSVSGTTVPISVLADKEVRKGESRLTRSNKRVGALIRLELDSEQRGLAAKRVVSYLEDYDLPEGLSFDADREQKSVDDMQRDLGGALVLGSIFIFLLMGFLFESVVLPLSVLPSIPLSFVGVWWFLFITGEHIDALAGIGIVLLLGVVVNNAIVLIDFVGQARRDGLSRDAAIIAAGELRFRPIMMTALTTIGGMLPLAFSAYTGEGIPYGPFGKALVGGMTTATVLTLVVVPVTYTYLDDLRSGALAWLRRLTNLAR